MTLHDELAALAAKATPGEWEVDNLRGLIFHRPNPLIKYVIADMESAVDENAALIVALRNAAPSLIATAREAEALRAENARLREALFNAIALIGHSVPMDATALVAGELLTAHGVWHQGRAALEQGEVK